MNRVLVLIYIFIININFVYADDLIINAEVVDIKDKGNLIVASGNVDINDINNISIKGEEAKYSKINETIKITGNVVFFDKNKNFKATSDEIIFDRNKNIAKTFGNTKVFVFGENNSNINFEIKGNNSLIDQNNKTLEIDQNVILIDHLNDFEIYSEKIVYNKNNETVDSLSKTEINYKNEFLIKSNDISYNKNKKVFYTKKKTLITDNFQNSFQLSGLFFDIENKLFKAKKIELSDKENNTLFVENGFVNIKTNELVGSDFNLELNKNIFGNSENDPRLIGRYIITDKSNTIMKKSKFTTCKNIPGKCPSWQISADEVIHKKEKKRIEYKNAWLEIYDVPVAYFPYFFHPDPTVERQSGFLFPQFINSSNLGFSTQLPYYKTIDHDKDLTISPRIYTNNNLFLQTEYRQIFKSSSFISDFSYNKKNKSNSHFFSSLKSDFEDSFYEMKIELVSNKDYLKKYQIQSPLISNYSTLNSFLNYEKYGEDYDFSSSISIIEDLEKNDSDKYEYIFPNYEFNKETSINNKYFDNFKFKSSGNYHKFDTNVDEADIINDFIFSSNNLDSQDNLNSNLDFLIRNINAYGDRSKINKDGDDYKLLSSILLNLDYPLFKERDTVKSFLTPKASIRYSPTKGLNLKNEETLLTYNNVYDIDRVSDKTVEEGISTTLGIEYKSQYLNNEDRIKFGIAMNFREKFDDDLPVSSSLNKKTSDLIGYSGLNITENLSLNYNFSIQDNLNETNYSLVNLDYKNSSFQTSFEYLEKSNLIGDESYLTNFSKFELNKSNALYYEINQNIDKNITDYYNLIYEYQNDCLKASIKYNKQFYKEDSANPEENIFFKISFIPFGEINSPNLND